MNEAANYATYNFRVALEAIVGQKGFTGTVTAAQTAATSILRQLVEAGAITSWRALSLSLTGDVLVIDVEIAPVVPVNFIKTTVHLVTTTITA